MKVLYIGNQFFEYEKKIKKLIEEELGFEVIFFDISQYKYEYKNYFEKILNNLYYKNIKKENLKNIKLSNLLIEKIKEIKEEYDIIFYIRPYGELKYFINFLSTLDKKMICHQWDTMSSLKGIENQLHLFSKKTTFDPIDAEEYGMKFLPNFYTETENNLEIEYEIFTIQSYDYRFSLLEEIAKNLSTKNKKYLFLVYTQDRSLKSKYIKFINEPLSLNETYNYMKKSKVILELGHLGKQRGLSFRAIESLGLRKKLVTNYTFIKEYDFYIPRNIYILEKNNIDIPMEFFEENYQEIDSQIYEKYSGKNWIKNIFIEE
jgi:hypothetical protein